MEDGPTGDVLGLVFYEGGVRYQLGGVSTTGTTQDNLTYGQYSSPSGIYFAGLEAEEIPEVALKAKQMNSQLSGGFELSFTSNGKEYKNLTQAEAFAGKLTAVGVNVTDPDDANEVANSTDTEYYFRTSDGRYIVLEDEYLGTNHVGTTYPLLDSGYQAARWFSKQNRLHTEEDYVPKRGDMMFFQYYDSIIDHTALVTGTKEENGVIYVLTIEGNIPSLSDKGIKERVIPLDDKYIYGYGSYE